MVAGDTRITALRKGALEFCVLALLRDGERYGVELVRALGEDDGLEISEGTLYPLLSRLRRDGVVETVWQESPSGPPRRYYALSDHGRAALADFTSEWVRFRDSVDSLLGTTTFGVSAVGDAPEQPNFRRSTTPHPKESPR
jgi:PadR family transcriptional regulator PadR